MSKGTSVPIWVKPKINRPSLSPDYFPRHKLLNELNAKRRCPLTVMVGPAGYGKTTLLVSWLSNLDWPSAWVNLDSSDNTLYVFVQYIVTAIQKLFPGAMDGTAALLHSISLPEAKVLTHALTNDLDQIDIPFVLALDDYHVIQEPAIHELLKELLRYPFANFHLALATRHDPPLPLSILRAKGLLFEIRAHDLRFNDEESAVLLKRVTGLDLNASSIEMLTNQLDGWAAGLYVTGLTLRRKSIMSARKPGVAIANHELMAYLFDDVLMQQPQPVQEFLVQTSILRELNQELCEAVAGAGNSTYEGQSCLDYLVRRNLFLTRVGEKDDVFRYHHLFQTLLQLELKRRHGEGKSADLCKRASDWHAMMGQPEEALRYAIEALDYARAVQIISQFRIELMNNDEWHRLDHWLSQLPREVIEASAEMLVTEAYIAYVRFSVPICAERLNCADALVGQIASTSEREALAGEIAALRAWLVYQYAGDAKTIQKHAELALRLAAQDHWSARTLAWLYAGGARFLQGHAKEGLEIMQHALNEHNAQYPGYRLRLITSLCFLYYFTGDLTSQQRAVREGIRIGSATDNTQPDEKWGIHLNWARYHLGAVLYHRNELAEAETVLKMVVERRYQTAVNCAIQSMLILALIKQAQGRPDEAARFAELASQYVLEMRSTTGMPAIQLFEIHLAVMQGRTADALQSLKKHAFPERLAYVVFLYNPYITFVKAHLAAGTPAHLAQAETMLASLHQHATSMNHAIRLMEVLALMALLADARNDQRAAMTNLEQALLLAQPEGNVRTFADMGIRMGELLSRFHSREVSPRFVQRIVNAIARDPDANQYPTQDGLLQPLTDRELEVLALLMKRMSNKEIADALFISLGTVKHHTHVIFEKLEVHSRREAVLKAMDLNLPGYKE